MRSLGDVSAQPAKGLRHPEKGPEKGHLWETVLGLILGQFGGNCRGGAKKGLKRARSYIYIATRAFWALFGAWGGSCKGQPRRARKGPPTNPLLTGGHAELWRTTRNPQKGKIAKNAQKAQNRQK